MSNWDRNIAERKVDFTAREIYKLIREVSPDIQAEIIIEILCNEDSRINDAVSRWLSENSDSAADEPCDDLDEKVQAMIVEGIWGGGE